MLRTPGAVLLTVAIGFVLVAGCSSDPKRYRVSGTVKYKDALITNGTITFLDEKSGAAIGGSAIKDGVYEIPAASGLPAGKYKVAISYPDPKGASPDPNAGDAPGVSKEVKEMLPAKYNRDTELRAEVKAQDSNDISFDLK